MLARIAMARRASLMRYWPALAAGAIAIVLVSRGAVAAGAGAAVLAALLWAIGPRLFAPEPKAPPPSDADARAALGVGLNATRDEIRRAYRLKMASAHPDRGGRHDEAARLTAARDLLLKRAGG